LLQRGEESRHRRIWQYESSRTSMSLPVTAAATAITGLTRWVRAPLPWRPTKLRLEVDAQRPARCHQIAVHADVHGATRLAPLKARTLEYEVEALSLRLSLHQSRSRHHQILSNSVWASGIACSFATRRRGIAPRRAHRRESARSPRPTRPRRHGERHPARSSAFRSGDAVSAISILTAADRKPRLRP